MTNLVLQIAAEVISRADRDHSADAVLREALRSRRLPTAPQRREITGAVFNYYRWLGWLDRARPLPTQIKYAVELAQGFAERSESFSDAKLVERAVPPWVTDEMTVSPAWVRALQAEPKLWLRARREQGPALVQKLGAAKWHKHLLPDAVEYKGEEDLFCRPEFHAGEFEIQDVNSQAVGWLAAPQPGETWWDACAGEGGKTLHFSDLMTNKGLIWASDRAEWRLKNLKRRAARARSFNFRAASWDGGRKLPTRTHFDGVLLDAPCSGLGTWQRNPHARWTTMLTDVKELGAVQLQLLLHVAAAVKPGGKLVYAVCTLTRAETMAVTEAFGQVHPEFEPMPLAVESLGKEFGGAHGDSSSLTLWPQTTGGNGMFVAGWRHRKG